MNKKQYRLVSAKNNKNSGITDHFLIITTTNSDPLKKDHTRKIAIKYMPIVSELKEIVAQLNESQSNEIVAQAKINLLTNDLTKLRNTVKELRASLTIQDEFWKNQLKKAQDKNKKQKICGATLIL